MTRGRPVSQVTKLGRLIHSRGEDAYKVAAACSFANRTLTEYLAGRRYIRTEHAHALAKYFQVPIEDIVDADITTDLTDCTGLPLNGAASVKDLPTRPIPQPTPHTQPKSVDDLLNNRSTQTVTIPLPVPRRK